MIKSKNIQEIIIYTQGDHHCVASYVVNCKPFRIWPNCAGDLKIFLCDKKEMEKSQ